MVVLGEDTAGKQIGPDHGGLWTLLWGKDELMSKSRETREQGSWQKDGGRERKWISSSER